MELLNPNVEKIIAEIEAVRVKEIGVEPEEETLDVTASAIKKPCIFDVSQPCDISNQVLDVCRKCPVGHLFALNAVFKKVVGLAINMLNSEIKLQNLLSGFLRKN